MGKTLSAALVLGSCFALAMPVSESKGQWNEPFHNQTPVSQPLQPRPLRPQAVVAQQPVELFHDDGIVRISYDQNPYQNHYYNQSAFSQPTVPYDAAVAMRSPHPQAVPQPQFQQGTSVPEFHLPPPEAPVSSSLAPAYLGDAEENQENADAESTISDLKEAQKSIEELTKKYEELAKKLEKKTDKPDSSKGFSAPKIGGRVFMHSANVLNQNSDSRTTRNGTNYLGFREVRLSASGTAYDFLDYKVEFGYESEAGQVNYKDMFLGIKNLPYLGYARIGNQYVEDGGSEMNTGSINLTFMELPDPIGSQFSVRRMGVSSRHLFAQDRGRLFLGVFGSRDVGTARRIFDDNQGVMFNARLTYAPMYKQDGRCLLLFGGYYNFTDYSNLSTSANALPGKFATRLHSLHSGTIYADNAHKFGLEAVYQNNQFTLQGDVFVKHYSDVHGGAGVPYDKDGEDKTNVGGMVMARYFLTPGSYRKYNKESAAWGGVVVDRPFLTYKKGCLNCANGAGAWEVAGYYSVMSNKDFACTAGANPANNTGTISGTDHQLGLALNWYWNPNLRWTMNYIHQMGDVKYAGNSLDTSSDILAFGCNVHF